MRWETGNPKLDVIMTPTAILIMTNTGGNLSKIVLENTTTYDHRPEINGRNN